LQDQLVDKTLAAINLFNLESAKDFPVRAFVLDVEKTLN
jgi:hypothetical protein